MFDLFSMERGKTIIPKCKSQQFIPNSKDRWLQGGQMLIQDLFFKADLQGWILARGIVIQLFMIFFGRSLEFANKKRLFYCRSRRRGHFLRFQQLGLFCLPLDHWVPNIFEFLTFSHYLLYSSQRKTQISWKKHMFFKNDGLLLAGLEAATKHIAAYWTWSCYVRKAVIGLSIENCRDHLCNLLSSCHVATFLLLLLRCLLLSFHNFVGSYQIRVAFDVLIT